MKRQHGIYILLLTCVFAMSGCVVRTYQMTKDRVDQDLAGNRGYLKGAPPQTVENPERKSTRTTQVVEVELRNPIRLDRKAKSHPVQPEETGGNKGYITEPAAPVGAEPSEGAQVFEKYKVGKDDTLQKISLKYYGTTKKWQKIYNANKDILSSPNKVYPGQVINIPVEPKKETTENLK